jgi:hypothetical protein
MARLTDFDIPTRQLDLDELLAEIEAEEQPQNGQCPFTAECYESLGIRASQCAWNLDGSWRLCGGYKRRKKGGGG